MRKFFFILIFPVLLGGAAGSGVNQKSTFCITCVDSMDTILPADTMISIVAQTVDSFRTEKTKVLDSLVAIKDSLAVELYNIKRERLKKVVIGHIDSFPLPPSPKHPAGGYQKWEWLYFRYPDGHMNYYKPRIKTIYY